MRRPNAVRWTLMVLASAVLSGGVADQVRAQMQPPLQTRQPGDTSSLLTIRDSTLDPVTYRFLKLGVAKDYLGVERGRIIDQLDQAIPPLYEPRTPFHGYTLPPGAWRVGVTATRGRNPGDFGRDDFYALFFNNVQVDFTTVDLDLLHGFEVAGIHDLVLRVNLPYKISRTAGTGHPFRIDPMTMTMEGSSEGFGDLSVTLKKKWLDQANGVATISTMVGMIVPTAEDNQTFNASQTVFMGGMATPVSADRPMDPTINLFGRATTDLLQPRSAQPGNGSWGGRLGFGLSRQFERSALHVGAMLDLLARNNGIKPGHELRYGLSFVVPPLRNDYLTLDLAVTGLLKGDEHFPGTVMHPERDPVTGGPVMDANGNIQMFVTPRPSFAHGNITFFSPSVILLPAPNFRLFINPTVRLLQPNQGPSPAWTFAVGQTITY